MSDTSSGRIFLSYRRDDTRHIAGRLFDRLAERFGDANVFMDVDSIEPGLDFGDVIERAVSGCAVLLALIGKTWLHTTDEHGQRRLDDPDDLVLLEVKSALDRDIRVIPVLVDGASAPRREDLPEVLAPLARRHTVRLDHETFRRDIGPLLDVLDRAVRPTPPPRPQEFGLRQRPVPAANRVATDSKRTATLLTSEGDIRINLFPDHAPETVANFVGLASGEKTYSQPNANGGASGPFYDGSRFHRVIKGFMIQGGDPTGTGRGGPGYRFADEPHPEFQFDRPYLLAMANAGPNTNGSQFFITVGPTPHLNRKHTIFGEVADAESRAVVDAIANTPTRSDRPLTDVVIRRVEVGE